MSEVIAARVDPTRGSPRPPSRLAALDYARLLAALSVVGYHWFFWDPRHGDLPRDSGAALAPIAAYGYLGVQLFFLISGFVIFLSASGRPAASFLAGRATRLYPAFWAGALLTTATLLVMEKEHLPQVLPRFVANLTMVPAAFGQRQLDGVYWTLTLELEFYALVFLFLAFGARRWLDRFFPSWAIAMFPVTAFLPGVAAVPLFGGLFTFFAGGAIIALVSRSGWTPLRAIGLAASIVGSVVASLRQRLESGDADATSSFVVVVIVIVLYLVVYTLATPRMRSLNLAGSRFAGGVTYPVYLCHAVFGVALLRLFGARELPWYAYLVALVAVIGVAALVHRFVERAAAPFWRRFFGTLLERPANAVLGRLPRRRGRGPTDGPSAGAARPLADGPTASPSRR